MTERQEASDGVLPVPCLLFAPRDLVGGATREAKDAKLGPVQDVRQRVPIEYLDTGQQPDQVPPVGLQDTGARLDRRLQPGQKARVSPAKDRICRAEVIRQRDGKQLAASAVRIDRIADRSPWTVQARERAREAPEAPDWREVPAVLHAAKNVTVVAIRHVEDLEQRVPIRAVPEEKRSSGPRYRQWCFHPFSPLADFWPAPGHRVAAIQRWKRKARMLSLASEQLRKLRNQRKARSGTECVFLRSGQRALLPSDIFSSSRCRSSLQSGGLRAERSARAEVSQVDGWQGWA